jgi:hypothetical protein
MISLYHTQYGLAKQVHSRLPCSANRELDLAASEPLTRHVFFDRSMLDVYANGHFCLTSRVENFEVLGEDIAPFLWRRCARPSKAGSQASRPGKAPPRLASAGPGWVA